MSDSAKNAWLAALTVLVLILGWMVVSGDDDPGAGADPAIIRQQQQVDALERRVHHMELCASDPEALLGCRYQD